MNERFKGVHAATVCPMDAALDLDLGALSRHVATVANVPGIRGLLINGHAGENFVLNREELRTVVETVREAVGRACWITAGVNHESSLEAARIAADAEAAGADALLVFPPNSWGMSHDTGMVVAHHDRIIQAASLPIVLYQAPVFAGRMAYSVATLEALIRSPRIKAIKEGSWEVATYEQNWRTVKTARPDIAVLGSGDEHLLTSGLIGSDGAQVSLAAVVPELIVALDAAMNADDWTRARTLHEAIYGLSVAIYRAAPGNRATARLKTCLQLLGRIPADHVRPPIARIAQDERAVLERILAAVPKAV